MGIKVVFPPTPRFDQSLMAWLGKVAEAVRDAFGRTPGGEWRTGTYNVIFSGGNAVHIGIPYGYTFKTGIPLVTVSPFRAAISFEHWVTNADASQFDLLIKNYQYAGGAGWTGTVTVRWLAIVP